MPTYGYECKSCGHSFDVFQNMSDEPLKTCPRCGKDVRRLINGGTGIIFKGSGFYVTDKGKAKPAAGAPKEKEKTETPKTENSSPAAPAAAAEHAVKSESSSPPHESSQIKKAAG
ncbi:MAG: zinc ribbon domain-containing protein [Treponema sp.]|jgi:putative FmdB family regulatory protein|nr:zinc ribbon domain-containing protein [Treponema sp.]